MRIERLSRFALLVTVAVLLGAGGPAIAENAIKAPAQKSIGRGKQEIVPCLIVMNADGANLMGTTLALWPAVGLHVILIALLASAPARDRRMKT